MVLGETGVIPVSCDIKRRVVNYWFKISRCEKQQKIAKCVYDTMCSFKTYNCYMDPWLHYVEESLGKAGMAFVFNIASNDCFDFEWFKHAFKLRIEDGFKQEWHDSINNSNSCITYRLFKDNFKFEQYLISMPPHLSSEFLKFRTRNCILPVACFNIPNRDTACFYCEDKCGDEFHVVMQCKHFKSLREQFIPPTLRRVNVLNFKKDFTVQKTPF